MYSLRDHRASIPEQNLARVSHIQMKTTLRVTERGVSNQQSSSPVAKLVCLYVLISSTQWHAWGVENICMAFPMFITEVNDSGSRRLSGR